ncbi:LuxR C-terminal-related transcriptional regulator [Nocardia nepalensis]|uniref:LuxR C-terminal-related transcriptional regulator n=1 Tax=Nocardia nepalensis TaxID=3375448 RepID=UPI003B66DAF7
MSVAFGHENVPPSAVLEPGQRPALSSREIEVLLAWIGSDSKVEVGRRLYISLGTVNTHLARIRDKYAAVGRPAHTKAALVSRALQDELIGLDQL